MHALDVQKLTELAQNRWLRRSSRLSWGLCLFMMAFFSLTNADITNYAVMSGAVSFSIMGIYAATLLREKADALDIGGSFASKAVRRSAVALPLILFIAFLTLLALQLWYASLS